MQQHAYNHYSDQLDNACNEQLEFTDWTCQQQVETCPQFNYWATVLQLELTLLVYVHCLRQASCAMYVHVQCESKKSPLEDLTFFHFFSQTVENF